VTIGADAGGDDHGHVDHSPALANPLRHGVKGYVGVGPAVKGPVPEVGHHGVEALGHLRNRRAGDPLDAHGLDHVVDTAGRDALHVALGHHRHQGPLGPPAGSQEPLGQVGVMAQLGDGQVHGPGPGVKGPGPVAVAGVDPLGGSLAVAGAADGAGLGRHEDLGEGLDHLSDQVGTAVSLELLAQPAQRVNLVRDFHRIISSARLGWTF